MSDSTISSTVHIDPTASTVQTHKTGLLIKCWGWIKTSLVKIKNIPFKWIVLIVLAVGLSVMIYRGSSVDVKKAYNAVAEYAKSYISSPVKSYPIEVVGINGYFTRSWWLMGTPQIAFRNPVVRGELSQLGEMKFDIAQPNGPTAKVEGLVTITPALVVGQSGNYSFSGSGISGKFTIEMNGGEATFNDFSLSVNLEVAQKKK